MEMTFNWRIGTAGAVFAVLILLFNPFAYQARIDPEPMAGNSMGETATVQNTRAEGWDIIEEWNSSDNFTVLDIATGDLEGDGDTDILVSGGNFTKVYTNLGDGTFKGGYEYHYPGHIITKVGMGDFNNDNKEDLVMLCSPEEPGSSETLEVRVLGQVNTTDFVDTTLAEIEGVYGTGTPSLAIGDIDKRNGLDLVVGYTAASDDYMAAPSIAKSTVLYNTGMFGAFLDADVGEFEADPGLGRLWTCVALSDLDGDTYLDVVMTVDGYEKYYQNTLYNEHYTTTVAVYLSPGGMISPVAAWNGTIWDGQFVYGLAVGDFTLDGVKDIAISTDKKWINNNVVYEYPDGRIYVFKGKGDGTFFNATLSYEREGMGPIYGIVAGSFDEFYGMDLAFFQAYSQEEGTVFHLEIVGNFHSNKFHQVWQRDSLPMTRARAVSEVHRIYALASSNFDNTGLSDLAYGGWDIHTLLTQYTDILAPPQVPKVWAYDNPEDDGGKLVVEWDPSVSPDVVNYRVYCSEDFLTNVDGLTHEKEVQASKTQTTLTTADGSAIIDNTEYFVAVTPVDGDGNENTIVASYGPIMSEDNLPPAKLASVNAVDVPNDDGGKIKLTWSKSSDPQFSAYNIYMEDEIFPNCRGLNPTAQVKDIDTTSLILSKVHGVPVVNEKWYYAAVTAMDINGNEDRDNVIVAGPVAAKDNIPPAKIAGLFAHDVPNDNGGSIEAGWAECTDAHFHHYNIYMSTSDYSNVGSLEPSLSIFEKGKTGVILTEMNGEPIPNNVDIYVAMTAVDLAENEDTAVTTVKTRAIDNVPPTLINLIQVSDVPDDQGGAVKLMWTTVSDPDFARYEIYMAESEITDLEDAGVVKIADVENISKNTYTVDSLNGTPLDVGKTYYFSVIAVDVNGNMGIYDSGGNMIIPLGSGTCADNLLPSKVTGVQAEDTPGDHGETIDVQWNRSNAPDFDHYNVYVDVKPMADVDGMTPDYQIEDISTTTLRIDENNGLALRPNEDYYVAVTAVDVNGNEDTDVSGSTANARPTNEFPPEITVMEEADSVKVYENVTFSIRVDYEGPNALKYHWYVDGKQMPTNKDFLVYRPGPSDAKKSHEIKVAVTEDISGGLSDSKEWNVSVPAYEYKEEKEEGEQGQGPGTQEFMLLALVAVIIIAALLLFGYRFRRRRKTERAAEEIEESILEGEEESKEELQAKLEREKALAEPGAEGPALPGTEPSTLPKGAAERAAAPMLEPPEEDKPSIKVKRALPRGDEEQGTGPKSALPPGREGEGIGAEPNEGVGAKGEIDEAGLDKAIEEEDYLGLIDAMESKEEGPEPGPETPVEKKEEGPRTGPLDDGTEIKRDGAGWITECIMRNKLPSKYVCPEEQKSECKLPCIQKMNK